MKLGYGLRRQAILLARCLKPRLRFGGEGSGGEDGSALVEIAVTLPLMLFILTGAVSFSLAFYHLQELGNAVSAAAQGLGTTGSIAADPCAHVVTQVEAALPGWTASDLTFTVVITDAAGKATPYGPTAGSLSCTAAASGGSTPEAANEPQTVTVSFTYSWFSIFKWKPFGASTPSSALSSSETTLAD